MLALRTGPRMGAQHMLLFCQVLDLVNGRAFASFSYFPIRKLFFTTGFARVFTSRNTQSTSNYFPSNTIEEGTEKPIIRFMNIFLKKAPLFVPLLADIVNHAPRGGLQLVHVVSSVVLFAQVVMLLK